MRQISLGEYQPYNEGSSAHARQNNKLDHGGRMSRGDADEQAAVQATNGSSGLGTRASRRGASEAGGMLVYDDFAVTNDPTTGIPGRPSLRSELRRRRLFWITAVVVGLALGVGLYKKMPPPYKATALVQIAPMPGTQAIDEVLTEVALAQSRKVAMTAMSSLQLPEDSKSVQGFMGSETVTSPSDQFVLFTVKASSADDAVARAKALAHAYLDVRALGLTQPLAATIKALSATIATEEQQLSQLQAQIATVQAQPTSAQQQAKLASLQARQSQLHGSLIALRKAVQTYATSTRISNEQVIKHSFVLGQVSAAPRSKIKYPAIYAMGGLFAGLAIGMGWVIVSALISTRPRRRYDIARALGAPVRLSVGRIRVSKRSARGAPEGAGGRGVQQIATHLSEVIGREQQRASLAVVAVDDPIVPALSLISTAFASVNDGRRVVLADLTPGAHAARMLGCKGPGVHRPIAGQQNLTVVIPEAGVAPPTGPIRQSSTAGSPPSVDPEIDHAYHFADLLLTLVTIDLGLGAEHLGSWATDAVVVMTAGKPSAAKIRTIAELIRFSGTTLASGVIVGADKLDDSLGVLTFIEDDDEPSEEPVRGEFRDADRAQPNGVAERGSPKPEAAERSHIRRESADGQHAGSERRAAVRPEATSPEVKPASKAETTMPDLRYEHLRTQPRRAVDLRKEDEKRQPDVPAQAETAAQPSNARPQNAPGPGTRPYSEADENSIGSQSSRSSAWRG